MKGLRGSVALVTGGTGLLGSAISTRLAAEGATVAVASRNLDKAERWVEQHRSSHSGSYIALQLDLSDPASIRSALDALRDGAGTPGFMEC